MPDATEFSNTQAENSDDKSWIDEEIQQLNQDFSRYMHSRQTLYPFSERTLRRYRPDHLRGKRAHNKGEREFSHRMFAAYYIYQKQSLLSTKIGADFASALMAVSATECLLLGAFLELKPLVVQTAEYRRIIRRLTKLKKKRSEVPQKQAHKPGFQQFMSSLQIAEQYKIAAPLGLIRDEDIDGYVAEVLRLYKFKGATGLLQFVKNSRNQLHTGRFVASVDSCALTFDVMYSPERMALFHMHFALCAYLMMGAIKDNLDRMQIELAIAEGRIRDGDEAEE